MTTLLTLNESDEKVNDGNDHDVDDESDCDGVNDDDDDNDDDNSDDDDNDDDNSDDDDVLLRMVLIVCLW